MLQEYESAMTADTNNLLSTCGYDDVPIFSPWSDCTVLCKVVHVYDGDTCYLAFASPFEANTLVKIKARLAGIDAFEMSDPSGAVSRDRLMAWIVGGDGGGSNGLPSADVTASRKTIMAYLKKNSPLLYADLQGYDKYGRVLCVLKRRAEDSYDQSANAFLVREGHAHPYA